MFPNIPPAATKEEAYEAGRDRALNGANTKNCHFRFFSTIELKDEWERGVADGEAAKRKGEQR